MKFGHTLFLLCLTRLAHVKWGNNGSQTEITKAPKPSSEGKLKTKGRVVLADLRKRAGQVANDIAHVATQQACK